MTVVATGAEPLTYTIKEVDPGTMSDFFDMNDNNLNCKKIDSDVPAPVTTAVTITVTDENGKFNVIIVIYVYTTCFHRRV